MRYSLSGENGFCKAFSQHPNNKHYTMGVLFPHKDYLLLKQQDSKICCSPASDFSRKSFVLQRFAFILFAKLSFCNFSLYGGGGRGGEGG